jgi:hypothetical protein
LTGRPRLGSNAGLCDALGQGASREPLGDVRGTPLGGGGAWPVPLTPGGLAKELQITRVAAGHHATEMFGPRRIAAELPQHFPGLDVAFVACPSPPSLHRDTATPTDR